MARADPLVDRAQRQVPRGRCSTTGPASIELDDGWSRIGRSPSADIRLDDPTVSRRHAVIVCTPDGELRVLDDRSMNGIGVNGESVDWSPIADGDELGVGRYTLHVIEISGAAAD